MTSTAFAAAPNDYDAVADEYYDSGLHPTTANLGEASKLIASHWLPIFTPTARRVYEVGAGRSFAAEWMWQHRLPLQRLTITDCSSRMLRYSSHWEASGAAAVLADAEHLPISDGSQDLVVALLGDPYNNPAFWLEVQRVLVVGGRVIFTTPTYEWARAYRAHAGDAASVAIFELGNGRQLAMPSHILPRKEQDQLIGRNGLMVETVAEVSADEIQPPLSPKLAVASASGLPVVRGYLARKTTCG